MRRSFPKRLTSTENVGAAIFQKKSYVWLQNEKHHWGSLAAGARYCINPRSRVNIFLDGMLKADWFIATSQKRDKETILSWHAFGYRRFARPYPSAWA